VATRWARVDSPDARPFGPDGVTVDLLLLLVLMVPIAVWAVLRWLPERRERAAGRQPAPPGPRKRWWQP